MEDTGAVSAWMGSQELLLGHILDVEGVQARVNDVSRDEIHKLANEVLVTEKLNLAVVGPFRSDRIQQRLEALLKL